MAFDFYKFIQEQENETGCCSIPVDKWRDSEIGRFPVYKSINWFSSKIFIEQISSKEDFKKQYQNAMDDAKRLADQATAQFAGSNACREAMDNAKRLSDQTTAQFIGSNACREAMDNAKRLSDQTTAQFIGPNACREAMDNAKRLSDQTTAQFMGSNAYREVTAEWVKSGVSLDMGFPDSQAGHALKAISKGMGLGSFADTSFPDSQAGHALKAISKGMGLRSFADMGFPDFRENYTTSKMTRSLSYEAIKMSEVLNYSPSVSRVVRQTRIISSNTKLPASKESCIDFDSQVVPSRKDKGSNDWDVDLVEENNKLKEDNKKLIEMNLILSKSIKQPATKQLKSTINKQKSKKALSKKVHWNGAKVTPKTKAKYKKWQDRIMELKGRNKRLTYNSACHVLAGETGENYANISRKTMHWDRFKK